MSGIVKFVLDDCLNIKNILEFALYKWKTNYKLTIYLDDLKYVKVDSIDLLFVGDKERLNGLDFTNKINYAFYVKGDEKETLGYISCICYAIKHKKFPSSKELMTMDNSVKPKLEVLFRDEKSISVVLTIINKDSVYFITSVVEDKEK